MAKKPKKQLTFELRLTQLELVHIRDLFNISLPVDMRTTVSQFLANAEERPLIEAQLWRKVARVCEQARVPLDDEAPDFVIAPSGLAPLGVFKVADRISQVNNENEAEGPHPASSVLDLLHEASSPDGDEIHDQGEER